MVTGLHLHKFLSEKGTQEGCLPCHLGERRHLDSRSDGAFSANCPAPEGSGGQARHLAGPGLILLTNVEPTGISSGGRGWGLWGSKVVLKTT